MRQLARERNGGGRLVRDDRVGWRPRRTDGAGDRGDLRTTAESPSRRWRLYLGERYRGGGAGGNDNLLPAREVQVGPRSLRAAQEGFASRRRLARAHGEPRGPRDLQTPRALRTCPCQATQSGSRPFAAAWKGKSRNVDALVRAGVQRNHCRSPARRLRIKPETGAPIAPHPASGRSNTDRTVPRPSIRRSRPREQLPSRPFRRPQRRLKPTFAKSHSLFAREGAALPFVRRAAGKSNPREARAIRAALRPDPSRRPRPAGRAKSAASSLRQPSP